MNGVDKIVRMKREELTSQLSDLSVKIATLELEKAIKRKELHELIALKNKEFRELKEKRFKKYSRLGGLE